MSARPELAEIIRHCDVKYLDAWYGPHTNPADIATEYADAIRDEALHEAAETLRNESGRQPRRVIFNEGLFHAARLVDRMTGEKATATATTATPFFQEGHTYTADQWEFRCLAITPHPRTGEPRAVGLVAYDGGWWDGTALDPDDYRLRGWTDVTNTTTGDNK